MANLVNKRLLRMTLRISLPFALLLDVLFAQRIQDRSFAIDYDNNTFVKDGKPFRYISGSIHYSRVPHQYWDDRLHKIAAAGLNAIQTYVPWNIHETDRGRYDFTGQQDIVTFLKTAQKYDLLVILRPGPYICAEWEFGGLPAWLMNFPDIKVRTMDTDYIQALDQWYTQLYTVLKPMLYVNGGPIISVQIENEYGSYYACDYNYLNFLAHKARSMLGPDVVLFTTDGDGDGFLKCGTISDAYATVDFGITYNPSKNFAIQRHKEPKGPLVNSEYYTGWLDHWGKKHSVTPTEAVAKSLDLILALGANVNMYMFEGGTNFGFWSGAEISGSKYKAIPTSYDYDAPLSEAGDISQKYLTVRRIVEQYNPTTMDIPPSTPKSAYGRVTMMFVETLLSYIHGKKTVSSKFPLHMEALQQYYGFMFYKHVLKTKVKDGILNVKGVRDRGYVSVGSDQSQMPVGVVQRGQNVSLNVSGSQGDSLYILVENQGRVGYGNQMNDNRKGLVVNVTLNGENLTDWIHVPVSLTRDFTFSHHDSQVFEPSGQQSGWMWEGSQYDLPAIYQGMLKIQETPQDTYLDMSLWTKGQVFVNGENLGRYWPHKGPQVRLYVPKYMLQEGSNTVTFIELEKSPCDNPSLCYIQFKDQPLINGSVTPDIYNKVNVSERSCLYPECRSGQFGFERLAVKTQERTTTGDLPEHQGHNQQSISLLRWIMIIVMDLFNNVFNVLRF